MLKTNSVIDHKITGVTTVAEGRGVFENACMVGASFWHHTLDESEFVGTVIFKSDFVKASMENTFYKMCNIRETDFIKANLRKAVFNNCTISYCDFSMADLSGARFILSDAEAHGFLTTCVFDHSRLEGAEMNGASLYAEILKYKNK